MYIIWLRKHPSIKKSRIWGIRYFVGIRQHNAFIDRYCHNLLIAFLLQGSSSSSRSRPVIRRKKIFKSFVAEAMENVHNKD